MKIRGTDETSGSLFSYLDLEERIPASLPLRKIRQMVNDALASLDGEFAPLYADFGRPSIAPERLIRASLIQILFSVRSERQLMEQMQYNLMFRWFVGLGIDDPVWVATVFTKNRDRLLTTDMSRKVMAAILAQREVAPLLSEAAIHRVPGLDAGAADFAEFIGDKLADHTRYICHHGQDMPGIRNWKWGENSKSPKSVGSV